MVNINDRIGNYVLIEEINSGGFGSVYKARHHFLEDIIVAIKVLHPHLIARQHLKQFFQEAQLLYKLKHRYILPILDVGIHDNSPYIIMEYAAQGSLDDRIQKLKGKPLPLDEAVKILIQVGNALQHAHAKNVTHRDLKPDNILFNANGDVLLADFGLAVVLASGRTHQVGLGGTVHYMAPEQFAGDVSMKSDLYALGCITYEILTGKRPFVVEYPSIETMWYQHAHVAPVSPRQYNPDIPEHIEQTILTAMAKDRKNRYADVAAFIAALNGGPSKDQSLQSHLTDTQRVNIAKIKIIRTGLVSIGIGINLGYLRSIIAVMKIDGQGVVVHTDPGSKRMATPNCVWKDPRSKQVIVGRKAYSRIGTNPKPIRSIQRLMGKSTTVQLTDEYVAPEVITSYILKEMKQQIEEDVACFATDALEWVVKDAVITVPAYFDLPQLAATRKAAEMAGLQVLELLCEPVAVALYHCWFSGVNDGIFMVYTLDEIGFDASVLRCTEGSFEVLGISGNNQLGGEDIDMVLAEELQSRLLHQGYALDLDPKNDPEDSLRFDKLRLLAKGVKEALSTSNEFVLRDRMTLQDKTDSWVDIDMMFERHKIEKIILPVVERTISYCLQALELAHKKAGVTLANVDAIILAGGTTHIPLVREILRDTFCASTTSLEPRAKCNEPIYKNVDTIVAMGAAVRAAMLG